MKRILALPAAGLLSGCAAVVPHTLQTPLVQQQGETELSANIGLHGSDLQVAHGLSDRLTLTASGHQRIRRKHGHWAYSGEAGAGYGWTRRRHQWSVYGGLGYGAGYAYQTFNLDSDQPSTNYRVRYAYGYVQPTYRLTPSPAFGLSMAVKVAAYDFLRWRETSSEYAPDPNDPNVWLRQTTTVNRPGLAGVTLQPGYNMFFGLTPHLRLQVNQSLFLPLENRFPSVLVVATGLGLQYFFGGRPTAE